MNVEQIGEQATEEVVITNINIDATIISEGCKGVTRRQTIK